jgi:hypothetical protein
MDSGSSYKQYINDGKIRKSAFFEGAWQLRVRGRLKIDTPAGI